MTNRENNKRVNWKTWVIALVIIMAIFLIAPVNEVIHEYQRESRVIQNIHIEPYSSKGNLILDVVNRTNLAFKVPRITCQFKDKNGANVGGRDYTVYSVVKAKTHRVFKDYYATDYLDQSDHIHCKVNDMVVVSKGEVMVDLAEQKTVYPYQFPAEEYEIMDIKGKTVKDSST